MDGYEIYGPWQHAVDFKYGSKCKLGHSVIIEPDVIVGDNVKLGHRVILKSGTRVGNNTIIDDGCITTGACWIGSNVNIRTGAIISRATIIEDWCFVGPGVITNHTKYVDHGRAFKAQPQITYIASGSIIGSNASLVAGLYIGPGSVIAAGALGTSDTEGDALYIGSPWRKRDLPKDLISAVRSSEDGKQYAKPEMIRHLLNYMPDLNVERLAEQLNMSARELLAA
jgi:acetyltransferase-like isoleucine patch superfamily enzyme